MQAHPSPSNAGGAGVLALASLYPHRFRPQQGAFNRQQFAELAKLCRLGLVAPTPWTQLLAGPARWGAPAPAVPADPFPVRRPVFLYPPRLGRQWQGRLLLASAWRDLRALAGRLAPRVLLANWLYPEGEAGRLAAQRLGLPLVIQVLGSDLMVIARDPVRRPLALAALGAAAAVTVVSRPLKEELAALGVDAAKVAVVANGVDPARFFPADRAAARHELGLPATDRLVLFLGNLVAVKDPAAALLALARLPGVRLVMAGQGPLLPGLRRLAARLGLAERVVFPGGVSHRVVPRLLAACDLLALPSLSEGEPNAVLEALACGRPVVASRVGGVPDLLREGENGHLVRPNEPGDLARALTEALDRPWDPAALAASVAGRSWAASARRLHEVLEDAAQTGGTRP